METQPTIADSGDVTLNTAKVEMTQEELNLLINKFLVNKIFMHFLFLIRFK